MFDTVTLVDSNHIERAVSGSILQQNGKLKPFDFVVHFKRYETDEFTRVVTAAMKRCREMVEKDPENAMHLHTEVCRESVIGWSGVKANGVVTEFSAEALEAVLAINPVPSVLYEALETMMGLGKEKTSSKRQSG